MGVHCQAVRHSRQGRAIEDEGPGAGLGGRARTPVQFADDRCFSTADVEARAFARKYSNERRPGRGQRDALVQPVDLRFAGTWELVTSTPGETSKRAVLLRQRES